MLTILFEILSKTYLFIGSIKGQNFEQPLSKEEEQKYLLQLKEGNEYAREQLIVHNLRLVAHIVKKYDYYKQNKEDFISVGTIGLIKAIDTYDLDKGNKLTTYAACCIQNEILMYLRKLKKYNQEVSLSEVIHEDQDGSTIELIDALCEDEVDIVEQLHVKEQIKQLQQFMHVLNRRELDIIEKRFGLHGQKVYTQKEIAKQLQISRSYVSRIEKRAFVKLYQEFVKVNQKR